MNPFTTPTHRRHFNPKTGEVLDIDVEDGCSTIRPAFTGENADTLPYWGRNDEGEIVVDVADIVSDMVQMERTKSFIDEFVDEIPQGIDDDDNPFIYKADPLVVDPNDFAITPAMWDRYAMGKKP